MSLIEIRQMWPGGPLRRFSEKRPGPQWILLDGGGYANNYVCAQCRKDVKGVHRTPDGWLCGECRRNAQINPQQGKTEHLTA